MGNNSVLFLHQQFSLPSSQVLSLETSTTSWAKWSFQVTGGLDLGACTMEFRASTGALQTLSKTLLSGPYTIGLFQSPLSAKGLPFFRSFCSTAESLSSFSWMACPRPLLTAPGLPWFPCSRDSNIIHGFFSRPVTFLRSPASDPYLSKSLAFSLLFSRPYLSALNLWSPPNLKSVYPGPRSEKASKQGIA